MATEPADGVEHAVALVVFSVDEKSPQLSPPGEDDPPFASWPPLLPLRFVANRPPNSLMRCCTAPPPPPRCFDANDDDDVDRAGESSNSNRGVGSGKSKYKLLFGLVVVDLLFVMSLKFSPALFYRLPVRC